MDDGNGGDPRGRSRPGPTAMLAAGLAAVALLAAACGGSSSPAATASKVTYEKALAYARCMRSHGVPTFPNPTRQGTFVVNETDQGSQQERIANFSCRYLLPDGGSKRTPAEQRVFVADNLAFAACMRSRGFPDFPDPVFQGPGVMFSLPQGVDPNSPQFESAQRLCQPLRNKNGGGAT
ncbi:MAG: hypothetical protein ACLP3Q_20900 [Streptosporangiaceae bacterium]|jgi:hypothetical protein